MDINGILERVAKMASRPFVGSSSKGQKGGPAWKSGGRKEPEIIKHKGASSLFEKRKYITRPYFRRVLKRAPGRVPHSGFLSPEEKLEIEEKDFPKKKFGALISRQEYGHVLRELRKKSLWAKSPLERIKARRKQKLLKYLISSKEDEK